MQNPGGIYAAPQGALGTLALITYGPCRAPRRPPPRLTATLPLEDPGQSVKHADESGLAFHPPSARLRSPVVHIVKIACEQLIATDALSAHA